MTTSKILSYFLLLFFLVPIETIGQDDIVTELMPVRGLSLKIPKSESLPKFLTFIENELAPAKVNTLLLRVDYDYQYTSHPELVNKSALTKAEIKAIVQICQKHQIQLVPQINLLGHQSWHSNLSKLLTVYPQFDETPHVQLPEKYEWPNADGLYCKSYCPLHPDVHEVVFDLVDEITAVFETTIFHAGMDEVFYIGDDKCPRCGGRDKAELFAQEVTKISNHLAQTKKELWIWGDRLIDGKTTGIGMWEASMNNTHRAIDLIPKDVVICDWHYERADPTAAYFAMKGFRVITCPWRTAEVASKQVQQTIDYRANATATMKPKFQGMMQTVWSSAEEFMAVYYGEKENSDPNGDQVACFKALVEGWQQQ